MSLTPAANPASIDDERLRYQQFADVVEPQKPYFAMRHEARRRRVESLDHAADFGHERPDAGLACDALGPCQRRTRRPRLQATHRDFGEGHFVCGARGGRQGRGIEILDQALGLVEAPCAIR